MHIPNQMKFRLKNTKRDAQEESQANIKAFQWNEEEAKTDNDIHLKRYEIMKTQGVNPHRN